MLSPPAPSRPWVPEQDRAQGCPEWPLSLVPHTAKLAGGHSLDSLGAAAARAALTALARLAGGGQLPSPARSASTPSPTTPAGGGPAGTGTEVGPAAAPGVHVGGGGGGGGGCDGLPGPSRSHPGSSSCASSAPSPPNELKPGWGGGEPGTAPAAAPAHRPAVLSAGGCRIGADVVEVPAGTFSWRLLLPPVPELLVPTFLSSPSPRRTRQLVLSRRPRPAEPKPTDPEVPVAPGQTRPPHPFTPSPLPRFWRMQRRGRASPWGCSSPVSCPWPHFAFSPFPPRLSFLLTPPQSLALGGLLLLVQERPRHRVCSCHIWNPPGGCSQGTAVPGGGVSS